MRDYVGVSDDERTAFWSSIERCPDATPREDGRTALMQSLPEGARLERFAKRTKGGGSLGRPRFVGVANWRGGRIVREAKAFLSSGWDWATGGVGGTQAFENIAVASTRAPDPFLHLSHGFVVRRLSADTRKVERGPDFDRKLDKRLLTAMGSEIGSIHADSTRLRDPILGDLRKRGPEWLHDTAKSLAMLVEDDHKAWKRASR
jgi:hypothetical protein